MLCGFLAPSTVGALLLRAIGTFTCLYSIFDIYWDILASQGAAAGLNDAVAFSQLTGAEPQVVGVAWLVICLVFFLLVLKSVLQEDGDPLSGLVLLQGGPALLFDQGDEPIGQRRLYLQWAAKDIAGQAQPPGM